MKKIISLILAIILTLNIGVIAFAAQTDSAISKIEAENLAIDFVECTGSFHETSETLFSDGKFYVDVPVYKVVSTVGLTSGEVVRYTTYVDKYTGQIYYRTAEFQRNIAPLTRNEALEYAYKVLSITEDNTTLITNKQTTNDFSEPVYQFTFCKNNFVRYDCTINPYNGFIDKVSVGAPANVIERILLLFKMLIARISILDNLDRLYSFDFLI